MDVHVPALFCLIKPFSGCLFLDAYNWMIIISAAVYMIYGNLNVKNFHRNQNPFSTMQEVNVFVYGKSLSIVNKYMRKKLKIYIPF